MPLSDVTQLWGTADIVAADPGCDEHDDAIYRPMNTLEPGAAPWGLHGRDGRLIEAAAYRRHGELIGQSEMLEVRTSELDHVDGDFVYVGPMLLHYGHFVIASLARLWAVREGLAPGTRLLCHADWDAPLWHYLPHIAGIMAAFGLAQDDFVRFTRPTVLRRVRVPAPAIEEQGYAHRIFAELGAAVGRHYGLADQPRGGRPIYLSKTRLEHGISRVEQEREIEQACAARGIDIVHPQELSFPDQLRTLWGARTIAATVGSALHGTLFLPGPSRVVGLAPVNTLVSNFAIVDRLRGNQSRYVHPAAAQAQSVQNFHSGWSLPEMPSLAAEFADLAAA